MTPVVVRATVRARLLGLPLLRLDADVTVRPADVVQGRAVVAVIDGDLTDAAQLLADATRTLDRAR